MKPILIALGVALLGVGGYFAYERLQAPVSAENHVKVETQVIEVETLQKRILDAQEAAKTEIETEAKAAYDEAVSQALLEIELEVREAYEAELEAERKELQKQSTAY